MAQVFKPTTSATGLTNPMTTTGDIIYSSDNSGTAARAAIGATGQILAVVAGLPAYASSVGPVGGLSVKGTNTNDSASAGYIGEFISANSAGVATGTSGSTVNVCSISLTAGDWDVSANAVFILGSMTGGSTISVAISTTSAATDSTNNGGLNLIGLVFSQSFRLPTGVRRLSLSATTTVYLTGFVVYSVAGTSSWGTDSIISARRVR